MIRPLILPCFLLFVFWLPIPLGSNRLWAWSLNEMVVALLLAAAVVWIPSTQWIEGIKRAKWLLLGLALMSVWSYVQSFEALQLSQDRHQAFISALKSLHYWQIGLLAAVLINTPRKLTLLAVCMIASGLFQAFYASVITLLDLSISPVWQYPLSDRASGSFVYQNHLANFLMMSLCLGFGLLVAQLKENSNQSFSRQVKEMLVTLLSGKALLRLALIIMVIALVLTRSRMGNTAFFTALTVGSVLLLLFYQNKPKSLYVLIISLFVIDAVVISQWFGLEKLKQRLVETSLTHESRDEVVLDTWQAVQQEPITGYGAGSFYSTYPQFNQSQVTLFYDHAHNDYLQFLFEYGAPMTALMGLMVLFCGYRAFRAFQQRRDKTLRGLGLASLMVVIGMLIHISVDFPLQAPATAIYFILSLLIGLLSQSLASTRYSGRA